MWQKILGIIKAGRLSEPSTYAGIAVLILAACEVFGWKIIDHETGVMITEEKLKQMLADPVGYILLAVAAISSLVSIFKREKKP